VFKTTVGLFEEFGPRRVKDTPISELAILGAAMGAAMTGLKPVAEIMFSDFLACCWDYVANEDRQDALHERRADHDSARHPHGERRGLALRRAAFAKRRELGDGDTGPEGRCASTPA